MACNLRLVLQSLYVEQMVHALKGLRNMIRSISDNVFIVFKSISDFDGANPVGDCHMFALEMWHVMLRQDE